MLVGTLSSMPTDNWNPPAASTDWKNAHVNISDMQGDASNGFDQNPECNALAPTPKCHILRDLSHQYLLCLD
jgi:hypothetical protein